jgi:hypothetical protein
MGMKMSAYSETRRDTRKNTEDTNILPLPAREGLQLLTHICGNLSNTHLVRDELNFVSE